MTARVLRPAGIPNRDADPHRGRAGEYFDAGENLDRHGLVGLARNVEVCAQRAIRAHVHVRNAPADRTPVVHGFKSRHLGVDQSITARPVAARRHRGARERAACMKVEARAAGRDLHTIADFGDVKIRRGRRRRATGRSHGVINGLTGVGIDGGVDQRPANRAIGPEIDRPDMRRGRTIRPVKNQRLATRDEGL